MGEKKAYLFMEKVWKGLWYGLSYDGITYFETPRSVAESLWELREKGYDVVYSDVPLNELFPQSKDKYREIRDGAKQILAAAEAELAHWKKYPGLRPSELKLIAELKDAGIKEGVLWFFDVDLYPTEDLEFLREQMGSAYAPVSTYYLSAGSKKRLIGRIAINQYAAVLKYFIEPLSLRNARDDEAKEFSKIGVPLSDRDLEYLIEKGIKI